MTADRDTTEPPLTLPAGKQALLIAAQNDDREAFGRLVEPYRGQLHAHCYRMLGSHADADDAMQDTLLRAWRGLRRLEQEAALRAWMYRIATNTCLRLIERRPKRILPIDYAPASDPHGHPGVPVSEQLWVEPYPDLRLGLEGPSGPDARYEQHEAIELAFIAALQHLPARQRAVLVLRDVLGFSAKETAELLDTSPVSVDSALQRAHKTVDERLPRRAEQATLRQLGDSELNQLVGRFVAAWERNDVDAVISMLAHDARFTMPPLPSWYRGRSDIELFLRGHALSGVKRWQLVGTSANGQPALAGYLWDEPSQLFTPYCLYVLRFRETEIDEITAFVTPEAFERFGLPAAIGSE
jgi:RNA polymerase sigma-70 factor, ECF subfamily